MRFEVLFEFCGFITGTECNNGFNFPWPIFGCMRDLAAIMGFEPGVNIFGKTRVVTGIISFTD